MCIYQWPSCSVYPTIVPFNLFWEAPYDTDSLSDIPHKFYVKQSEPLKRPDNPRYMYTADREAFTAGTPRATAPGDKLLSKIPCLSLVLIIYMRHPLQDKRHRCSHSVAVVFGAVLFLW